MFRLDKMPNGSVIEGTDTETVLQTRDGKHQAIPCLYHWVCGAALLSKMFGISKQRIYQLRDLGVLTPETRKDHGEQVYNIVQAIRDYAEFKRFGQYGMFSGGPIKCDRQYIFDDDVV